MIFFGKDMFDMKENIVLIFVQLLAVQPSTVLLQVSSSSNKSTNVQPKIFNMDSLDFVPNNFEETLIMHNELFVDKTEFIDELIGRKQTCELISRPSRWAKTFNMEMISSFFDVQHYENGSIDLYKQEMVKSFFVGGSLLMFHQNETQFKTRPLKISKKPNAMKEIGHHPTIFISFLTFGNTYDKVIEQFASKISELIFKKNYNIFLRKYCKLSDYPQMCDELLNSTGEQLASDDRLLESSLEILVSLLYSHFRKYVVVIIDEYDYPLHQMICNDKDFSQTTNFLTNLITNTFKGRSSSKIYSGIITGVVQLSRVGISSGIGVCSDCSVIQPPYGAHFGFNEAEVEALLEKNPSFPGNVTQLKTWFNGYMFGKYSLYNPLSIRACLESNYVSNYWIQSVPMGIDSGLHAPLHQLFMSDLYQNLIQRLYVNNTLIAELTSEVDFTNALINGDFFLSGLTALGYLTFREVSEQGYEVHIPNKEVLDAFKDNIELWTMKHVQELSFKTDVILQNMVESFKLENITYIQGNLSSLLSSIKETTPAELHCNIIFGLLSSRSDHWSLQRDFRKFSIVGQKIKFDCDITC